MKSLLKTVALAFFAILALSACKKKTEAAQEPAAERKIASAKDLEGTVIGVQAGTTGEGIAGGIKGATIKSFVTGIDAAMALNNGAIDAIILDELPAKEIVKNNTGLAIVTDAFPSEDYAIAVRKGDAQLLSNINKTISRIKTDGTYESLVDAFMPIDGVVKIPEVEFLDTPDVIKMGTNAAFPPFEYTEGLDVMGFDVTLSKIIAKDMGKSLRVQDMKFDGLIAALQSGSIDFIAAGMTATDERRENVDFSEPYFTSNQVIIIKE